MTEQERLSAIIEIVKVMREKNHQPNEKILEYLKNNGIEI